MELYYEKVKEDFDRYSEFVAGMIIVKPTVRVDFLLPRVPLFIQEEECDANLEEDFVNQFSNTMTGHVSKEHNATPPQALTAPSW